MHNSLTTQEKAIVLNRYKIAFKRFARDGVIDIDKRLNHKIDFILYRLEDAVVAFDGIVPALRQSLYWVVLVKEGQGQKNIGDFSFPIKNNTLFFIPSRTIHSSTYHSLQCSGYLLLFDVSFYLKTQLPQRCVLNRKVLKYAVQPYFHLDEGQAAPLILIFEKMLEEQQIADHEKAEMMAVKILELLISCDRIFTSAGLIESKGFYHPVVERFIKLLEENFCYIRTVQEYAQMLNMHPNHLNFLLKKHNGLSAKQTINNRIIAESKYLLSNSPFIIKDIANRLGFDDSNNFSTFFHKCTGNSPVAYRASRPLCLSTKSLVPVEKHNENI
jgi:AraC family transcriptional activator of pobA